MRMLQKAKISVALGVMLILVLSGCAKQTPAPTTAPTKTLTPTPTATPTGPYGELEAALSTLGDEKLFPPWAISATKTAILRPLFDSLLANKGLDSAPEIVERWEMAPDNLSWVFYVRKGVKFHNGDELTGKDVKFTLEQYVFNNRATQTWKSLVERVELVDDYAVRIYTKGVQPYMPVQADLSSSLEGLVLPKNYTERQGAEYFLLHPVGSGPFKFVRHVPGDMLEYEAVDKHWRQTPAYKKLTLVMMPEESTRRAALVTGQVDMIEVGLDAARGLESAGFRTREMGMTQGIYRLFGVYHPQAAKMATADVRVRQALSLAINRDEIIKTLFLGKAHTSLPDGTFENEAEIDTPYWKSYGANAYRYDPQEAKRLISEAGYPQGFTLKLYSFTMTGGAYLPQMGEVVAGYWGRIGVKVEIVPMDYGSFVGWWNGPVPQLVGQASVFRDTLQANLSKMMSAIYGGGQGHSLLGNPSNPPEVDKFLKAANGEPDASKRRELLAKVLKIGVDSYTSIPIALVPIISAIGPGVDIDFPKPAFGMTIYLEMVQHR